MAERALSSQSHGSSNEELGRRHQAEFGPHKNEEAAAGAGTSRSTNKHPSEARNTLTDLITAYKNVHDLPPPSTRRDLMIEIDQMNEAVLLPINGSMIFFHVGAIWKVFSKHAADRNYCILIVFKIDRDAANNSSKNRNLQGDMCLNEVSFLSKDPRHVVEAGQLIEELRIQVGVGESLGAWRAKLVTPEDLIRSLITQKSQTRVMNHPMWNILI